MEIPSANEMTSFHDLLALSDEQILEIEPDAQDVQVRGTSDSADRALDRQYHALDQATDAALQHDTGSQAESTQHASQNTNHGSPITGHLSTSEPPQWLAERMADPQTGAEARELWNGVQQSRQEAAAFREVFAKPEDARAAAERSRVLDDIDRAYFTGDSLQRAQLAASMLREDPAAFREMVFAGLRALEEAGKSSSSASPASQGTAAAVLPVGAQHSAPQAGKVSASAGHDGQLAAYAAFERAANEDLERSVGGSIDRTLDQALPHGNRAENAAMRGRLAATIRQDVEKAL